MDTDPTPMLRAAAIEDAGACDVDGLLAAIADQQCRAGRRVRGVVMIHPDESSLAPGGTGCARPMVLVDLQTRQTYRVSQPLGQGSTGCRADPQGFARASEVLRRAADEAPELVISNRFGALEAEGVGFRAELLEILARDLPLLTVVASRHRDAWQHFTGGAAVLPAQADVINAWLDAALGPVARTPTPDAES